MSYGQNAEFDDDDDDDDYGDNEVTASPAYLANSLNDPAA